MKEDDEYSGDISLFGSYPNPNLKYVYTSHPPAQKMDASKLCELLREQKSDAERNTILAAVASGLSLSSLANWGDVVHVLDCYTEKLVTSSV